MHTQQQKQEVTVITINKRYADMSADERLAYLADDLHDYKPCPYSRDVLLTWLSSQLASGLHVGTDAGTTLDNAYLDWIDPDEYTDTDD